MKKIVLFSACVSFALTSLIGAPSAVAQDGDAGNIARMYYVEVNADDRQQWDAGWKSFRNCLDENGGGNLSYRGWVPESGKLGGMLFRTSGHTWDDFDSPDDAAIACSDVYQASVIANTSVAYTRFTLNHAELGIASEGEVNLINLVDFDFKDVGEALELIRITVPADEATGSPGYAWESNITSFENWNMRLALLSSNYADLVMNAEDFWSRQATHHGEEEAAELRNRWEANINNLQSRIWRRDSSLDYVSSKD